MQAAAKNTYISKRMMDAYNAERQKRQSLIQETEKKKNVPRQQKAFLEKLDEEMVEESVQELNNLVTDQQPKKKTNQPVLLNENNMMMANSSNL